MPGETEISGLAAVMTAYIVIIPGQKKLLTLSIKKTILFLYRIMECIKYLKIKAVTCGWVRMLLAALLNIMTIPAADFIINHFRTFSILLFLKTIPLKSGCLL